ncbi:MAG: flavin reductase family protein [Planctomycetales bacterium]|nr:flavin reductase family protein [Planctomycetales bacterium]
MQSPAEIDSLLRLVDREVWIVTAAAGGKRGGLTATWVAQASIDRERPVILAGLAPNHFTTELVEEGQAFVAHLLAESQTGLAWDFAKDSGRNRDKLAGLATAETAANSPILQDSLAWFDCRVFARYDAGDRLFYWADVVAAEKRGTGSPLREQAFIRSLTDDQRKLLAGQREADAKTQRPLADSWRKKCGIFSDHKV